MVVIVVLNYMMYLILKVELPIQFTDKYYTKDTHHKYELKDNKLKTNIKYNNEEKGYLIPLLK